jgi:hypothetical protein
MTPISGVGIFFAKTEVFMIRCNKCNIEKENDKFQTYWHSTHQKHHTRKQCTECFYNQRNERKRLKRKESKLIELPTPIEIIQPVVTELEPEVSIDYSSNYKKCNTCHEVKPVEQFYFQSRKSGQRFNRCAECEIEKDRLYREKERKEQGGAIRVYSKPNTYNDEYQKDATFKIMKAYGWIFNENNGIWWKPGIKDENGIFFNLKPTSKRKNNITKEQVQQMIEYRKKGMKTGVIAGYMGLSISNVSFWLRKYEKERN